MKPRAQNSSMEERKEGKEGEREEGRERGLRAEVASSLSQKHGRLYNFFLSNSNIEIMSRLCIEWNEWNALIIALK
jgi:hypothetical protein